MATRLTKAKLRRILREQVRAEKQRRLLERTWRGDFVRFAALLDIIPRDGKRAKLRPNPIQAAYQLARTLRDIVLKPRQVGITTWELARDIWFFLTRPGAKVVIVCQSMADDSAIKEISGKLRVMFDSLREVGITSVVEESSTKWTLRGSDASLNIIGAGASLASAAKKGRSGTIHRLHITEIALFEFARETLNAILECVPGPEYGTEVVLESTAKGAEGAFFDEYQKAKAGKSGYRALFFSWLEQLEYRTELALGERIVPENDRERELVEKHRATPEQIKWYRAKVVEKGQDLVDQEYPSDEERCWLTFGRLFFDVERTKALIATTRAPIETRAVGTQGSQGNLRVWKAPQPGRQYVIAADPSEGVGGDPGAGVVLDRGTGEHVATIHGQFSTWEMARILATVGREYFNALIAVERNNHGHAVLQGLIREQKYTYVYVAPDGRPGWVNTGPARSSALDALHNAHREKHWSSPDAMSVAEMLRFIVNASGKAEAAPGAHDDLTLAHAIGWDVVCKPTVHRSVPANFVA